MKWTTIDKKDPTTFPVPGETVCVLVRAKDVMGGRIERHSAVYKNAVGFVVGNYFEWDIGTVLAWTPFPKLPNLEQFKN